MAIQIFMPLLPQYPSRVSDNGHLTLVIGRNAKTLRQKAGVTLNAISIAANRRGLKWSESRVADFERGTESSNLGTLVTLCVALAEAGCTEATLPALLEHAGGPIPLTESFALFDKEIQAVLRGDTLKRSKGAEASPGDDLAAGYPPITKLWERNIADRLKVDLEKLVPVTHASGSTEERVRKSLNCSSTFLANLTTALWGSTFSAERDLRAGPDASAQKRGQITRMMTTELRDEIEILGGPRQRNRRGE